MRSAVLEKAPAKAAELFAVPATHRAVKDQMLSIRVSTQFMEFVEGELAKLKVESSRDRQDFYRGAIVAAISNVKRSKSPAWQRFMKAIQPQARKYLGLELDLEGAKEMIEAGVL